MHQANLAENWNGALRAKSLDVVAIAISYSGLLWDMVCINKHRLLTAQAKHVCKSVSLVERYRLDGRIADSGVGDTNSLCAQASIANIDLRTYF